VAAPTLALAARPTHLPPLPDAAQARPFAAPDKAQRTLLAKELGVKVDKASTAEVMDMIQAKVDRKGVSLTLTLTLTP
jgi:hypothetical protein